MTPNDLVTVYEIPDAVEAEIIKNALIAEGWRVFSIDAIPGSTHAIAVLRWGGPGRPKSKGSAHASAS